MDGIKQRVYEILENLYNKKIYFSEEELFNGTNEINELMQLLTNNNPFFQLPQTTVGYEKNIKENTMGIYYFNQNKVCYSLGFIKEIIKRPDDLGWLIDTVYHEQRHHLQENSPWEQEFYQDKAMEEVYYDLFEGDLTSEEIKELNDFAHRHDLIRLPATEKRLRKLEFGAYWDRKSEADARAAAKDKTLKTFEMILNDADCPKSLKKRIKKSVVKYKESRLYYEKEGDISQKSFACLKKRVKKALKKAVKSKKKLDEGTYRQLLNGVLAYITKHSTLSENLEIAGWAVKNNYVNLIDAIDISKSISGAEQDVHDFIIKLSGKGLVSSENLEHLTKLFAPLKQNKREETMQMLVEYQIELRKPLILLENFLINQDSAEHISSKQIRVAIGNYLNYIERTGKVEDNKEFENIKTRLRSLIYQTSLLDEDEKLEFLKLYRRFDKVKERIGNIEDGLNL